MNCKAAVLVLNSVRCTDRTTHLKLAKPPPSPSESLGGVVLADANFGIFRVAHAIVGAGHDILFRMSKARFESLCRRAEKITRTALGVHYRLTWTPSPKEDKEKTRTSQTMLTCGSIFTT